MRGTKAPFGAICWTPAAHIDEAIRLVRAFDDRDQAIGVASSSCQVGERWAVVELETMSVVADGEVTPKLLS